MADVAVYADDHDPGIFLDLSAMAERIAILEEDARQSFVDVATRGLLGRSLSLKARPASSGI